MKNNHPPLPNPLPPPQNWSPIERKLWLAAKRAPANMILVTQQEFAGIENQLHRAIYSEGEMRAAVGHLDAYGYWEGKKDLQTATADAAFDARRYERATKNGIEALDYLLTAFQSLANLTDGGCDEAEAETVVGPIIMDAANKCGEALAFLRAQSVAKREQPAVPDKQA